MSFEVSSLQLNKAQLVGFAATSQQGFALPLYASVLGGNSLFVARSEIAGDAGAIITAYDAYWQTDPEIQYFEEPMRELEIGSAAVHVFLWDGCTQVGTLGELRAVLEDVLPAILTKAPTAYLGLMGDESSPDLSRHLEAASRAIVHRYGQSTMLRWAFKTYFPNRAKILLKQEARRRDWDAEIQSVIGKVRVEWDGGRVTLFSPRPLHSVLNGSESHAAVLVRQLFEAFEPLMPDVELIFAPDRKLVPIPSSGRISTSVTEQGVAICSIGKSGDAVVRSLRNGGWQVDKIIKPTTRPSAQDEVFSHASAAQLLANLRPNILIVVAGMDVQSDPWVINEFSRLLEGISNLPGRCMAVLAPILPDKQPSEFLTESSAYSTAAKAFEAILDTSLVRSPHWWGSAKYALDRRIADLIGYFINALVSLREQTVRSLTRRVNGEPSQLLTLIPYQEVERGAWVISEAAMHERSEKEMIGRGVFNSRWRSGRRDTRDLALAWTRLGGDFRLLSERALNSAAALQFDDRITLQKFPNDPSVLRALRYPDLAATFEWVSRGAPIGAPVMLCGEAPTLDALEAASHAEISLARYTDQPALSYFLSRASEKCLGLLPFDTSIDPPMARPKLVIPVRRGPTSGRFGADLSCSKEGEKHSARNMVRETSEASESFFSPWTVLPEGLARISIKDGRWPIVPEIITNSTFVDDRSLVLVAEPAVAGLLVSEPFYVWSKARSKPPTSWPHRFQLEAVFNQFPYEAFSSFVIDRSLETKMNLVRFTGQEHQRRLFEAALDNNSNDSKSKGSNGSWNPTKDSLLNEINNELLRQIGLTEWASETDILVRLFQVSKAL